MTSCDDAHYLHELVEQARSRQALIEIALDGLGMAIVDRDFAAVEAFAALLEQHEAP